MALEYSAECVSGTGGRRGGGLERVSGARASVTDEENRKLSESKVIFLFPPPHSRKELGNSRKSGNRHYRDKRSYLPNFSYDHNRTHSCKTRYRTKFSHLRNWFRVHALSPFTYSSGNAFALPGMHYFRRKVLWEIIRVYVSLSGCT